MKIANNHLKIMKIPQNQLKYAKNGQKTKKFIRPPLLDRRETKVLIYFYTFKFEVPFFEGFSKIRPFENFRYLFMTPRRSSFSKIYIL